MQIALENTLPERENGAGARKLRSLATFVLLCGSSVMAQEHPAGESFGGKIGRIGRFRKVSIASMGSFRDGVISIGRIS